MRLYSVYSVANQVLKNEWFLSTLKDDFDIRLRLLDSSGSEEYMSFRWHAASMEKVHRIIEAVEESLGDIIVYADIDIQFFSPIKEYLEEFIGDKDIVCQLNSPKGDLNGGFIVMRAGSKILSLWRKVEAIMNSRRWYHDQNALNWVIRYDKEFQWLRWAPLPLAIYGGGSLTGRLWHQDLPLPVPQPILLHHACWTFGIVNKIDQLTYVRKIVEKRCAPSGRRQIS